MLWSILVTTAYSAVIQGDEVKRAGPQLPLIHPRLLDQLSHDIILKRDFDIQVALKPDRRRFFVLFFLWYSSTVDPAGRRFECVQKFLSNTANLQ